jgi:hypothetical protein
MDASSGSLFELKYVVAGLIVKASCLSGVIYCASHVGDIRHGCLKQLFEADKRPEDGAGWHTDEMEVFRRLGHQQDTRRRTEVDDSVGAHAVAWVDLVQNDVQCRVASTNENTSRV